MRNTTRPVRAIAATAATLIACAIGASSAMAAPFWGPVKTDYNSATQVVVSGSLQLSQTPQWPSGMGSPPPNYPPYNPVTCNFSFVIAAQNLVGNGSFSGSPSTQAQPGTCNGRSWSVAWQSGLLGTNPDTSEYFQFGSTWPGVVLPGPFGNYTPATVRKAAVFTRGSATSPAKVTLFNTTLGESAVYAAGQLEFKRTNGTPVSIVD